MQLRSATSVCAFVVCVLLAACGKPENGISADPARPIHRDGFIDVEPGKRIGPIRIGMHTDQVTALLDTPTRVYVYSGANERRALRFDRAHLEVETDHDAVIVIRALPGWSGSVTDRLRFDSTPAELQAGLRAQPRERILASYPSYRELDYGGLKFRYWMVKGMPRCDGGAICSEEVPVFIEVQAPATEDGGAPGSASK